MDGEDDNGVLRGDARMVSFDCGTSGGGDRKEEDAEDDNWLGALLFSEDEVEEEEVVEESSSSVVDDEWLRLSLGLLRLMASSSNWNGSAELIFLVCND